VSSTSVTPITFSMWGYATTDASSVVAGSSYFSNGWELGMRKWDVVLVHDLTSTLLSFLTVNAVSTGAGATVVAGLTTA
jgi:hypothetical protein